MTIANIGNQAYSLSQGVYNAVVNATVFCGKAFTVLSKDAADTEVVLTLTKAAGVFIEAKGVFGCGSANSAEKAFQAQVSNLDGWNSLMTFPDAIRDTVLKITELLSKGGYALAADCVGVVSGLLNSTYEVVSFFENELGVSALKGLSEMTESANFQALAVGATARTAIAAEKVFAYFLNKEVDLGNLVNNVLDVTKNAGDIAFAAFKLTKGSEVALASASSLSAASKVAKYCFSKVA